MKFVAILFTLFASASAFIVPSSINAGMTTSRNTMRMAVDDMIGADTETAGVWDPLGLGQNPDNLYRNRQVELKHGRIAMLAATGVIVQSFFQLPDEVFAHPRPTEAFISLLNERPEALLQIVALQAVIELTVGKQDPNEAPGDVGFGAAFKPRDEEKFADLQLKELKNGRLAMMAISGMLTQEALTGQGPIEQILAGHISPFGDGQGVF